MSPRRAASCVGATVAAGAALLTAVAGAAAAASPPGVSTGPVTAVGPTSATAAGKVDPNGVATTWYVEYGTSASYGSKTSARSAGSGTATVDVSAALTGLAPGTPYHYRVVAASSAGTGRGADGIFATAAPPAVVTGAASEVSVTSAKLNGTVDPNGRTTSWYFEYGTTTGYGPRTSEKSAGSGTSATGVSASVPGLAPGRVYHFRLVATSDAGTSRGGDQAFSTRGAPAAVTGAATDTAPTSARLNGGVSPNGRSTSWYFEYGTTTGYGSRTSPKSAGSGSSPVNVSSSVDRLSVATTYHYRLVARNASGTTVGSDVTFSTSFPPGVATGTARDIGYASATATGAVDPHGRRTAWYFEYGTSTAYGSRTSTQSAGSGTSGRTVTAGLSGLSPATTYHYRVIATSDAGTSRGTDVAFTTAGVTLTAPPVPVSYGRATRLTGTVPTRRAGETVTVFAQRLGEGSFRSIANVLSAAGGVWSYLVQPAIQTSYRASWNGGLSAPSVVGVRPVVSLRVLTNGRFATRVVAGQSFAGRFVQLQRRTSAGRWLTLERARLNGRSGATFHPVLPRGRSVLRVAMSVNQAGAGYLAGFSHTVRYRRG